MGHPADLIVKAPSHVPFLRIRFFWFSGGEFDSAAKMLISGQPGLKLEKPCSMFEL